ARRLPGGTNDGGRLLVFEKKTVTVKKGAVMPDISALLPEDIEAMQLNQTTYTYMGFYLLAEQGVQVLYQPLHVKTEESAADSAQPPALTAISYEFFRWKISQEQVRIFNGIDTPVAMQTGELRPLAAWKEPDDAWYYDMDGWIYYGQPLASGAMTPLLLQSFSVEPGSPLLKIETHYRLRIRVQSTAVSESPLQANWNNKVALDNLGVNTFSNDAGAFLEKILRNKK
ncbi:MAG: hypothetical protein LBB50_00315, partial [Oscillospiraceae bacterium]|nr:hypothetical protein [Oscillospiraceae bacterium]